MRKCHLDRALLDHVHLVVFQRALTRSAVSSIPFAGAGGQELQCLLRHRPVVRCAGGSRLRGSRELTEKASLEAALARASSDLGEVFADVVRRMTVELCMRVGE